MNEDIRLNRALIKGILLALAFGGVIVLAVALIVTPANQFTIVSYVAMGIAIASFAGFIALDPGSISQAIASRTGMYAITSVVMSLIYIAFVLVIIVVIYQADIEPIDLTGEYSLSEQTTDLLESLEEPVTVVAFFSPEQRENAKLWLDTYVRASNEMISYEFYDVDFNPVEAQQYGVTNNSTMVFVQGERTANASFPSEQQMTTALVRVLAGEPRTIYVLTNHGERDFFDFQPLNYSTTRTNLENLNYKFETLSLLEEESVPEDADAVIVAGSLAQFSATEIEILNAYMEAGGSLLYLHDPDISLGTFGAGVRSVDFNNDGSLFATGGADGTVRIWDTSTRIEEGTFFGHSAEILDVAFSPDGNTLASIANDNTLRVWNVSDGELIAQLEGHQAQIGGVAFSPDGDYLASAGTDGVIRVWETGSYAPMPYSPIAVAYATTAVAFSPDSSTLAVTGGTDTAGLVFGWDVADGTALFQEQTQNNLPLDVDFSPDGETIHIVARDGSEAVYDLESGDSSTSTEYNVSIISMEFTEDGTRVYSLSDSTLHIRPAGSESSDDDVILEGHTDIVWDVAIANDGDKLISGSADGDVRLWSIADGDQITVLPNAHGNNDPLAEYLATNWGILVGKDLIVETATSGDVGDEFTPVIYNMNPESPIMSSLYEGGLPPIMVTAHSVIPSDIGPEDVAVETLFLTLPQSSWADINFSVDTGVIYEDGIDIPGPVPMALSAENATTGGRVVVIGDADFASNNVIQQASVYGNDELMVSTMDWLAPNDSSITLPSAVSDARTLQQPVTGTAFGIVAIVSICLYPAAFLALGLGMWMARRRRR